MKQEMSILICLCNHADKNRFDKNRLEVFSYFFINFSNYCQQQA